jgi:hypothetical protein
MSIQALAWAIDQPLPGKAKLVLLALSNHADHTNGHVHFVAPTIARESSLTETGLWRYLGALERNGYLARDNRKSGEGEKREYWLHLDRDPGLPWAWSAQDGETDGTPDTADRRENQSPPSTFKRAEQEQERKAVTAPPPDQPPGKPFFVLEGSRAGDAWLRHCRDHRLLTPFTMTRLVDGRPKRGFWMPTLFPPGKQESAA